MLEDAFRALHICEELLDQWIKIEQNASQPEFFLEPDRHTHQKVEENFVKQDITVHNMHNKSSCLQWGSNVSSLNYSGEFWKQA